MKIRALTGAAMIAGALTLALPVAAQDAGTNAMLRAKGEAYHRAPDSEQVPAEVAETRRLNAEIAARNAAAATQEEADRTAFLEAQAQHQSSADLSDADRLQHEEALRLSAEAQVRYEQEMADWRATVAACEAGDRVRCRAGKSPAIN
jgi:hypothetical protein